ncbi:hypothetical protein [Psychromonas algicola]|uniref:hypothetical protein n=1 Tax=Psychromonas algicola TaxID=2555642 RepID=UPI001067D909|nr:hypothetical protein [Psychromonas sp. RZ5]TEW52651.1 hypothetical protein E2R67_01160 [Psychromonas sp. RZ5]
MNTLELQNEIKKIIGELGWSQKRLGREIYIATFDDDNDDEIKKFEEKIKKDLSRKTIAPQKLKGYLEIISRHHEFEKLDIILPIYKKSHVLSNTIQTGMMKISKEIHKNLK